MPPEDRPRGDAGAVLVGIDVGTSSIRAVAFDSSGRKLAIGLRPTPIRVLPTGGEYDPDLIFATVVTVLGEVAAALGGRPVAGIAVASIGESCVLVDAAGKAVAPSITWYDQRTAGEAAEIEAKLGRERLFAVTGIAVEAIFTLAKLLWMRAHWPDAMTKARRVLMMADWIAFRLSGVMATDPSLASRTLYFDLGRRAWAPEFLAVAGLDARFPAPLAESGMPLGPLLPDITAATGLADRPVVSVGGHDHILGAIATGLSEPGIVVNSIGTAEALLLATAGPLADPETIRRGYVQGAVTERVDYVCGSLFSAGGAMEWVRSVAGGVDTGTLIAEATDVPPGSRGVVFLPHLVNGPPPDADPDARGAFVGLTPGANRAVLYRSVLEGLALQSRLMLDGMGSLAGVAPVRDVRLIGGVARNALFLAIKASVLGRPLTVVEEPEATALGAALLAGVGAGIFTGIDAALAALDRRETVIEPDASAPRYAALRETVFAPVVAAMRPINRALAAGRGAGQ